MPEVAVVDEHDDDREIVDHRRRQLLRGHLEAAVAVDADDRRLRPRGLRADRGRDPVAHRPEPARGDEVPRPLGEEVLHRPHLVLADPRREDDVVAGGERLQGLHQLLRLEPLAARAVAERELVAPLLDLAAPRPRVPGRRRRGACRSRPSSSASAFFSGPTTGMSASRSFEISAGSMSRWTTVAPGANADELAGDAVVEARADRDEHVAGVHGDVRPLRAVHARPAEEQRVRLRERALAHQRRDHGQPAGLGERAAARRRRRR